MLNGNGYAACTLICAWAPKGVVMSQSNRSCGESTTTQRSSFVRPMSKPPPTTSPVSKRESKVMPKKSLTRCQVSGMMNSLSTWPNFSGETSARPQISLPPPPGSRGSRGAVMQYGSKSAGVTARLSARNWRCSNVPAVANLSDQLRYQPVVTDSWSVS